MDILVIEDTFPKIQAVTKKMAVIIPYHTIPLKCSLHYFPRQHYHYDMWYPFEWVPEIKGESHEPPRMKIYDAGITSARWGVKKPNSRYYTYKPAV